MPDVVRFGGLDPFEPHPFQHGTGGRALEREGRYFVGDIFTGHIGKAECTHLQPGDAGTAQVSINRSEASLKIVPSSTIRPLVVAPHHVGHTVLFQLGDVSRHHAVQHGLAITATDDVLLHRADVVGSAGVPHTKYSYSAS